MNVLIKSNQYSTCMHSEQASAEQVLALIEHPRVLSAKDRAPLAIWGQMVQDPELDPSGRPRCTGANVESIYCLQLDYDSGTTIGQFQESYKQYRWTLYTSYSYGYKADDRFRVIIPLAQPLPCHLLSNRRVKDNLSWNWPGTDPCCFDRGHWQLLPVVRSADAPYVHVKSTGPELWGGDWDTYEQWYRQDLEEAESRRKRAQELAKEADPYELLSQLENELQGLPVGSGTRYAETKRLLAKYAHRGLGAAVLGLACPWTDQKWTRRWQSLLNWASTLTE